MAQGHSVDEYLGDDLLPRLPDRRVPARRAASPTLASRVAEMLGVSRASAGEMLKRLEAEGSIERGEHKEALLTDDGTRARRARRPQAPDHRAAADRLHGLHGRPRRTSTPTSSATRSRTTWSSGSTSGSASRPLPARLAGRPGRSSRRRTRSWRRSPTSSPGARATIVRLAEHDGELLHWFYDEGLVPGAARSRSARPQPAAGQFTVRAERQRARDRREGRSRASSSAPRSNSLRGGQGQKRRVPGTVPGTCRSRTRHVPGTGLGRRSHVPGTVPPVNGGRNQSRYGRHERRADHALPETRPSLSPLRAPRGPHRAAARLRRRDHRTTSSSRAATPHRDRVQRRAAVREALAGDRGGTRPLDPRRAHLLPRPALVARAGARLAARLDAERLRGRQDPERRRDVGRGLSRVLACAPARSAVVRDPDRDRSRDDAGARLPRLPDVGGARATRCSSSPSPYSLRAVTKPSRAMAIAVPLVCLLAVATRRQFLALPLAYLAAVALCGRGDYRRHLRSRRAHGLPRRGCSSGVPGALRTVRRGDAPRASPRAPSRTGPSTTGRCLPYSLGLAIVPGRVSSGWASC